MFLKQLQKKTFKNTKILQLETLDTDVRSMSQ